MRLIYIGLEGYARFREKVRFDANGPLIALVGANNSGKSSALRAIRRLEDEEPIGPEQTRRVEIQGDPTVVTAEFLLDPEDIDAIADLVRDQPAPRWFRLTKRLSGPVDRSVVPAPVRDTSDRVVLQALLDEKLDENGAIVDEDDEEVVSAGTIAAAKVSLEDEAEKLTDPQIDVIATLAVELREVDGELADTADALIEEERRPLLRQRICTVLEGRRPEFIYFGEEERELPGEFDLNAAPNKALANFASLAELDLNALRRAQVEQPDSGVVKKLIEDANAHLKEAFRTWSQFTTTVSFQRGDGPLVELLVADEHDEYVPFEEQSEGFQAFVGLAARVMQRRSEVPPIVLIDEIETHLHYDAEADLLRILANEREVDRVIYSTHSIGSMPPDLGTGVRVVHRVGATDRSVIDDHLWGNDKVGWQPLLLAVGAAHSTFIPLRDATIAEGGSEVIVLPTLLREAVGLDVLPFQVVPGAAQVRRAHVAGVDLQAPSVVWLLDSDQGGRAHAEKISGEVAPDRVLTLAEDPDSPLVLEDLLVAEVYVKAVNQVLQRYTELEFPLDALTATKRPDAVKAWCEEQGIDPPAKLAVCHCIVAQRAESDLLADEHRELVAALYERIVNALQPAAPDPPAA